MWLKVYAALRETLGMSKREITLAQPTAIREILSQLAAEWPSFGQQLWDENSNLTGLITVYVNGRAIQFLQGLDTLVRDTDSISLFPPIGGGQQLVSRANSKATEGT